MMLGIGLVICVAMFVAMFVVGGPTVEIRTERLQRTVQTDQSGAQNRGGQRQVVRGGDDAVGTDAGSGYKEETAKEKREPSPGNLQSDAVIKRDGRDGVY